MDHTENAVALFNERAKDYEDKFMDVTLYQQSFDLFCQNIIAQNAAILELGCGPGNVTHYLLQKRADFKILATDLSPNMIALAKSNNPNARFKIMDCRNLTAITTSYDGIMCAFCLPYLSKSSALKLIREAAKILKPNGVIYISTMEGPYKSSGFRKSSDGKDQLYQYFHEAEYLMAALEKHGFKLLTTQRKQYPAADGSATIDLILLAKW